MVGHKKRENLYTECNSLEEIATDIRQYIIDGKTLNCPQSILTFILAELQGIGPGAAGEFWLGIHCIVPGIRLHGVKVILEPRRAGLIHSYDYIIYCPLSSRHAWQEAILNF